LSRTIRQIKTEGEKKTILLSKLPQATLVFYGRLFSDLKNYKIGVGEVLKILHFSSTVLTNLVIKIIKCFLEQKHIFRTQIINLALSFSQTNGLRTFVKPLFHSIRLNL